MPTSATPSIASLKKAIDLAEQIEKLQSQLAALVGGSSPVVSTPRAAVTPVKRGKRGKRTMSPEAREKIAAAQRARWAKSKGTVKAVTSAPAVAAKPGKKKKGGLTPAGRAKLAAAMKARWAARKKGAPAPNTGKK